MCCPIACGVLTLHRSVGTWCEAEDQRLSALVHHFKQAWSSVAKHMPGREAKQCRERFNNIVDPSLSKAGGSGGGSAAAAAAWTPQQDAQLLALCEQCGHRLGEVVK